MVRRLLAVILLAAAVVGAILGIGLVGAPAGPGAATSSPAVGKPAPRFALRNINGQSIALSDVHHKAILVDFFATWCVPCRQEMPLISSVFRTHRRNMAVLAVDKAEPAGDVRAFARNLRLTFIPLLDPGTAVWKRYKVTLQPVSFWIDGTGTIRAIHYGPMNRAFMLHEIRTIGNA